MAEEIREPAAVEPVDAQREPEAPAKQDATPTAPRPTYVREYPFFGYE